MWGYFHRRPQPVILEVELFDDTRVTLDGLESTPSLFVMNGVRGIILSQNRSVSVEINIPKFGISCESIRHEDLRCDGNKLEVLNPNLDIQFGPEPGSNEGIPISVNLTGAEQISVEPLHSEQKIGIILRRPVDSNSENESLSMTINVFQREERDWYFMRGNTELSSITLHKNDEAKNGGATISYMPSSANGISNINSTFEKQLQGKIQFVYSSASPDLKLEAGIRRLSLEKSKGRLDLGDTQHDVLTEDKLNLIMSHTENVRLTGTSLSLGRIEAGGVKDLKRNQTALFPREITVNPFLSTFVGAFLSILLAIIPLLIRLRN